MQIIHMCICTNTERDLYRQEEIIENNTLISGVKLMRLK